MWKAFLQLKPVTQAVVVMVAAFSVGWTAQVSFGAITDTPERLDAVEALAESNRELLSEISSRLDRVLCYQMAAADGSDPAKCLK